MSGQKTPVERKRKPPAFCKPDLVLLASNVPLQHNLPQSDLKPLTNRLFIIQDLKPASFLKDINYTLNPKMVLECTEPSDDQEFEITQGRILLHSYVTIGNSQGVLTFEDSINEVDEITFHYSTFKI